MHSDLGLVFYKIGDTGPEVIYKENLPISDDFTLLLELGLYISLVISQGKGLNTEGLAGPLPWNRAPDHELMVYSFLADDETATDHRKIYYGTMHFLIMIFQRDDEAFIQSKIALNRSLDNYFNNNEKAISADNLGLSLTYIKQAISQAVNQGEKIVQEKAFDKLISNEKVVDIAVYSLEESELRGFLKGDYEKLPTIEELNKWQKDFSKIIILEGKNKSNIIIKFDKYFFYLKVSNTSTQKYIEIINEIKISYEIIFSYL